MLILHWKFQFIAKLFIYSHKSLIILSSLIFLYDKNINVYGELIKFDLKRNKNLVLIGPEGDFTEKENLQAKEFQFQAIMLGKSRLRTETAALVACHTINLQNQWENYFLLLYQFYSLDSALAPIKFATAIGIPLSTPLLLAFATTSGFLKPATTWSAWRYPSPGWRLIFARYYHESLEIRLAGSLPGNNRNWQYLSRGRSGCR